MDLLKERIMQEGRCFPGGILKVDSFVNHQMDPILMMDLAKEFVRLFKDIKYNKIITIEASGIAPAIMVGYLTNLPVVFVKKKQPKTMEGMITSVVHSFTKDRDYTVCVSNSYLTPEDHVIFIDDFLANGNASKGVMDLCEKAGAKIEAMGFIIEKAFQHGGDFLRKEGMRYPLSFFPPLPSPPNPSPHLLEFSPLFATPVSVGRRRPELSPSITSPSCS